MEWESWLEALPPPGGEVNLESSSKDFKGNCDLSMELDPWDFWGLTWKMTLMPPKSWGEDVDEDEMSSSNSDDEDEEMCSTSDDDI